jgi:GxxExxY protein
MENQNFRSEPDKDLDELVQRTLNAAVEVHRYLGPGYLESVYEQALAIELTAAGIPFERQLAVPIRYKTHDVGQGCLDFLIASELVVELKAVDALLPIHKAQVISYLKATRHRLGLLINFNSQILLRGVQRIILSNE